MNIQYTSDLHMNDWPEDTPFSTFIIPVAPILVIAGDICSAWDPLYNKFLAWCSQQWATVILISGNHEYYCMEGQARRTIEETDFHIRNLCTQYPNIAFLQAGESYILPGTYVRFVGATLWSDIDSAIWSTIADKKGDYKHTFTYDGWCKRTRKTHPLDNCARHGYHKECLRTALHPWHPLEKIIVVTHHMPTMELLEDHFKGEALCTCYASSDEDLFRSNIAAWFCGHSHRAIHYKVPGSPHIFMNARGYNRDHETGRTADIYDPKACVRLIL